MADIVCRESSSLCHEDSIMSDHEGKIQDTTGADRRAATDSSGSAMLIGSALRK